MEGTIYNLYLGILDHHREELRVSSSKVFNLPSSINFKLTSFHMPIPVGRGAGSDLIHAGAACTEGEF